MPETKKFYRSKEFDISFEPKKCIHAAECAHGLPEVFNPNEKPWINTEGSDFEKIAEVIKKCPSGALKYERHDNQGNEDPSLNAEVTVIPNGPLYITGDIELHTSQGELIGKEHRIALCRCGSSKNKPFCDNSHIKENFNAE
jgi:uncharacterized Fe-S cluster protein YjdI